MKTKNTVQKKIIGGEGYIVLRVGFNYDPEVESEKEALKNQAAIIKGAVSKAMPVMGVTYGVVRECEIDF